MNLAQKKRQCNSQIISDLDIIRIGLSFVYKKRNIVPQRLSVPRTVTKGQKRTFILTSGGREKKKKDDEQKTPAYYPHSSYQPRYNYPRLRIWK